MNDSLWYCNFRMYWVQKTNQLKTIRINNHLCYTIELLLTTCFTVPYMIIQFSACHTNYLYHFHSKFWAFVHFLIIHTCNINLCPLISSYSIYKTRAYLIRRNCAVYGNVQTEKKRNTYSIYLNKKLRFKLFKLASPFSYLQELTYSNSPHPIHQTSDKIQATLILTLDLQVSIPNIYILCTSKI